MTDTKLIAALQHSYYDKVIEETYSLLPQVRAHVLKNNGTKQDAEDVFQDALVILHQKVNDKNFTLSVPVKSYLMAIIRNCWYNELRKRKKLPETELEDLIKEDTTAENEQLLIADQAFNMLGNDCKALLIKVYYSKNSYSEIAKELGFSSDKVAKNQKYRCIQKAKAFYKSLLKN